MSNASGARVRYVIRTSGKEKHGEGVVIETVQTLKGPFVRIKPDGDAAAVKIRPANVSPV